MLVKVAILIELIAVMICVHRVYGKKLTLNIKSIIAVMLMFITLDIINIYNFSEMYSYVAYVLLFIYCMVEFKESVVSVFVSVILALVLSTIMQFLCALILLFIYKENIILRGFLASVLMLVGSVIVLPNLKIERLRTAICRRHWLSYLIFGFVISVVVILLYFNKMQSGFDMGLFIFGIPAIVIIMFLVVFWDKSVSVEKQIKREITTMQLLDKEYEELVEKVRLNQHGLDNHVTAILSTHYAGNECEELIEEQKNYCKEVSYNNQINELIFIENKVVEGFLYQKIKEIQKFNISIRCKVRTSYSASCMPNYYLIEILGCLLDNAKEAVLSYHGIKEMFIYFDKVEGGYKFSIGNTFTEVKYDDMLKWFLLGNTTKDKNRGLGLYQAKNICKEYDSAILCKNCEINEQNWIVMELTVKEDGA